MDGRRVRALQVHAVGFRGFALEPGLQHEVRMALENLSLLGVLTWAPMLSSASSMRISTATEPLAFCRIWLKAGVDEPTKDDVSATTLRRPSSSKRWAPGKARPARRQSSDEIRSTQFMAVKGSLIPVESARTATSTSWRMPNSASC
jgi:hypothetical protein